MDENDIIEQNNNDLEPEENRKVFVRSLSYRIDETTFRDYWKQFGTVLDARILYDREGHSRGFGFVTFDNSFSIDTLMKSRPHTLDNRVVEVKRVMPREQSHKSDRPSETKKLYIGGLKEPITEDDLKGYFSKYGTILDVIIMKNRDGQYRGFGFIEFDDYDPVDKILLGKNPTICGLPITVQKAQMKDNLHNFNSNIRPRQAPPSMSRTNSDRVGGPIRRGNLRHGYTPYNNRARDEGSSWTTWT